MSAEIFAALNQSLHKPAGSPSPTIVDDQSKMETHSDPLNVDAQPSCPVDKTSPSSIEDANSSPTSERPVNSPIALWTGKIIIKAQLSRCIACRILDCDPTFFADTADFVSWTSKLLKRDQPDTSTVISDFWIPYEENKCYPFYTFKCMDLGVVLNSYILVDKETLLSGKLNTFYLVSEGNEMVPKRLGDRFRKFFSPHDTREMDMVPKRYGPLGIKFHEEQEIEFDGWSLVWGHHNWAEFYSLKSPFIDASRCGNGSLPSEHLN